LKHLEDFLQLQGLMQDARDSTSPIVKVARENKGSFRRDSILEPVAEFPGLFRAVVLEQIEMETNEMNGLVPSGNLNGNMEGSPLFESGVRKIQIIPTEDGKAAENRVPMMALFVDRVFSVSKVGPESIGEKLELRSEGPTSSLTFGARAMLTLNFL